MITRSVSNAAAEAGRRKVTVAIVAAASLLGWAVPNAHAAPVDLACAGIGQIAYSPGIRTTIAVPPLVPGWAPRATTITSSGTYDGCVDSTGTPLAISGSYASSGTSTIGCETGPSTRTRTITWSLPGGATDTSILQESTFFVQRPVGVVLANSTGAVIAGRYAGDTLTSATQASLDPADIQGSCLHEGGLTFVRGPLELVLTPGTQSGCFGQTPTITGTPGADTITGTSGPDVIDGLGGNDTIDGLGGNDTICGSAGDDIIAGNAEDDRISGGAGNDTISGNAGDDLIFGDNGDDSLNGNAGTNSGHGGAGFDTCTNFAATTGCETAY
ncbi:calcium-binding protein [Streptomyces sp. NPDC127051]|uniref:calcium-binding protein n=1 Tax=Streptomyces sp. NPDC127051 TaxID=3347119 RepID=UPI00365B9E77